MPEATNSARVEVIADRRHGLVVRGVTRDQKEVQLVIKGFGLRWSQRQSLWYLPKSSGDKFSLDVVTTSRRLANRIHVVSGEEPRQLSLVSHEEVQDGVTAAGACTLPPIDSPPVGYVPGEGWVGSRYASTFDRQPAAITGLIRDDIKRAKRTGLLPATLDVSVRKTSHAGGWGIRIEVRGWVTPYQYVDPATGRDWIDPAVANILDNLKTIASQYNRQSEETGKDHSVRFHLTVRMDEERCCTAKTLASPSHPTFARSPYQRA